MVGLRCLSVWPAVLAAATSGPTPRLTLNLKSANPFGWLTLYSKVIVAPGVYSIKPQLLKVRPVPEIGEMSAWQQLLSTWITIRKAMVCEALFNIRCSLPAVMVVTVPVPNGAGISVVLRSIPSAVQSTRSPCLLT